MMKKILNLSLFSAFVILLLFFTTSVQAVTNSKNTLIENSEITVSLENDSNSDMQDLILEISGQSYSLDEGEGYSYGTDSFLYLENKGLVFPAFPGADGGDLLYFDFTSKKISKISPYDPHSISGNNESFWFSQFQLSPSKKFFSVFIESLRIHETCVYEVVTLPKLNVFCPLHEIPDGILHFDSDEILNGSTWNLSWNNDDTYEFFYTKGYYWQGGDPIDLMKNEPKDVWQSNADSNQLTKVKEIVDGEEREPLFSDLSIVNSIYEKVIKANSQGWITGYPDGTVRLNDPVNRAEFAKMLMIAFYKGVGNGGNLYKFSDVLMDQWYVPYLSKAVEEGSMSGYPDGKMRPGNEINRAEALKMALELVQPPHPQVSEDAPWYEKYRSHAINDGYDLDFLDVEDMNGSMTRGECVELILEALNDQGFG